jgi:hypothetical protein
MTGRKFDVGWVEKEGKDVEKEWEYGHTGVQEQRIHF